MPRSTRAISIVRTNNVTLDSVLLYCSIEAMHVFTSLEAEEGGAQPKLPTHVTARVRRHATVGLGDAARTHARTHCATQLSRTSIARRSDSDSRPHSPSRGEVSMAVHARIPVTTAGRKHIEIMHPALVDLDRSQAEAQTLAVPIGPWRYLWTTGPGKTGQCRHRRSMQETGTRLLAPRRRRAGRG